MIDLSDVPGHTYLHDSRDYWQGSLDTITEKGGPWYCDVCETASLLCYRCSVCGAELVGDNTTSGEQER
jgi:hypothetical protein